MRSIFTLSLFILFTATSFASTKTLIVPSKKANELFLPIGKNGQKITYLELTQMKVKDYELISGHKLNLVQKLEFKIAQHELKRTINADLSLNTRRMDSLTSKMNAKREYGEGHHYFRLFIILLAITAALSIISLFVPLVWILTAIAFIFTVVYFVLWLVGGA